MPDLYVVHSIASLDFSTGGPAESIPGLVRALRGHGVDAEIGCLQGPGGVRGVPTTILDSLRAIASFLHQKQHVAGENTLLVHDHGLWLPFNHMVASACRRLHIRRVVSPRGMLEPWALTHKRWKKRLAWLLYQQRDLQAASLLHATAEAEAAQLAALGLRPPTVIIPNGVEVPASLEDLCSNRADLLRQPPQASRTVLFLGRIHPKKGLPSLVEAWSAVRPKGWSVRVVGPDEGGHRAAVERLVQQAGLTAEWQFEGPVEGEAKWRSLASADLFVLPTHSENFGMAVAEALACGVPVITTTAAPWQGVETRRCGWWVEPNAAALTRALVEATHLTDEERAAMGRRGRQWMRTDFSWGVLAARMVEAYQTVLSA